MLLEMLSQSEFNLSMVYLTYYLIDCHAAIVIVRNIPTETEPRNVQNTSDGFVAVVTSCLYGDSISRNDFKTKQLKWICRKIM